MHTLSPEQFNESDQLREVVVGIASNMDDNLHPGFHAQRNNMKSTESASSDFEVGKQTTVDELAGLVETLENLGVTVHRPTPLSPESGNYNQVYPRDIGFVLGNKFIVSSMARRSRMNEWRGIERNVLDRIPANQIEWAPEDAVIEGGDVVVDKGHVFVGLSQRTTRAGFDYISDVAEKQGMKPVPIELEEPSSGFDILHLDCAFVPAGGDLGLIFEDGFRRKPKELQELYDLITLTTDEQDSLDTNMFTIAPDLVITRHSAHRINTQINERGVDVLPIQFDEPTKNGGNLRCCTLPLVRVN